MPKNDFLNWIIVFVKDTKTNERENMSYNDNHIELTNIKMYSGLSLDICIVSYHFLLCTISCFEFFLVQNVSLSLIKLKWKCIGQRVTLSGISKYCLQYFFIPDYKLINFRWIRTGTEPCGKIMYGIVLQIIFHKY